MVVNNPEWLELTKDVESFMVNGLIMSNQTNATIVNPQNAQQRQQNNDWQSNSQTPTVKTQNAPTATGGSNNNNNNARVVLVSKQNSHPFDVSNFLIFLINGLIFDLIYFNFFFSNFIDTNADASPK